MFVQRVLASGLFAALTVSASAISEDEVFAMLLKRQAPGTPAFECHSACGSAITLSRGDDPCTDEEFLSNYEACLACAGPDDIDIWKHYGNTLSAAGEKCGLSTTPGEGSGGEEPPAETDTPAPSATDGPEEPAPEPTGGADDGDDDGETPAPPPTGGEDGDDDSETPAPSGTEDDEPSASDTPVEAGAMGAKIPAAAIVLGAVALFL